MELKIIIALVVFDLVVIPPAFILLFVWHKDRLVEEFTKGRQAGWDNGYTYGQKETEDKTTRKILDGLKSKNYTIVTLDDDPVTQIKALFANVPSLKMARETLCRAQTNADTLGEKNQIWELIAVIDKLRPLGPDGKHGDRHTPYCGCEDR